MSETTTQTAAEINAQTAAQRASAASAQNAERSAPVRTPARKRPSAASRKSAANTAPARKTSGNARKSTGTASAPRAASPVRLVTPKQTGPTDTQVKRSAAIALVKIIDDAFGKLSDAQVKKLTGLPASASADDVKRVRDLIGRTWGSSLNYIPTPADVWGSKLPARKFTGGRGNAARQSA